MVNKTALSSQTSFYLGLLMALSSPVQAANASSSLALVSVVGVHLSENEAIEGITLQTNNFRLLAVCSIPSGWGVQVDFPPGTTGAIQAYSDGDVADLTSSQLPEMREWFLVRKISASYLSIHGTVDVTTLGELPKKSTQSLLNPNFLIEDADQCPAPKN
jgi:hypothetical protein